MENLGIAIAFAVVFLGVYIWLTEYNKGAMQRVKLYCFSKVA